MATTEYQRVESGKRVRQARLDRGMIQIELAQNLGISTSTVINWEKGRVEPRPRHWRLLAQILGRDIPWLRASDLAEEEPNGGDHRHDQ